MTFTEEKTENGYRYKSEDIGRVVINSPEKLDEEVLDLVFMKIFNDEKEGKTLMELEEVGQLEIYYESVNNWMPEEETVKPPPSLKDRAREKKQAIKNKIINLISKL